MKRFYKIFVFLFLLILIPHNTQAASKLPQPTDAFYVNDYADVIDDKVEEEIIDYGNQLYDKSGAQVVLVTVDFTNGGSLEDYAYKLFNKWGIGSKEKNNGLLILLSIGDDDYWAMQGEGLEDALTSGEMSGILNEYLEPDFAAKDYSAGAEKVYGAFIQELGGQWLDEGKDSDETKTSEESTDEPMIQYTSDKAGILSKKAEKYINEKSNESYDTYGAGFYVVTKDKCDKDLSFEEDAINTFEDMDGGSKDALLVLYKEDDNYWLLPGEEAESFATEDVLRDILDNFLEPQFANKKYSQGAMDTADEFYSLFANNLDKLPDSESTVKENDNTIKESDSTNSSEKGNNDKTVKDDSSESANGGEFTERQLVLIWFLFLLFIILVSRGSRRRRYRRQYGVPFNPYSRKNIRLYGPNGYWGPNRQPPIYHDDWDSGPRRESHYSSGRGYSDDNQRGAGRISSGSSSWSGNRGAGRSTSSGSSSSSGAGRSFEKSSIGDGGSSRGGGAGRSSGGASKPASHSSGAGRSSSGDGGSSRGGGAGRNK